MNLRKRGCRYFLNLGVFTLFALFFIYVFVAGGIAGVTAAYQVAYPARNPTCCGTPADAGLSYEEVEMQTADSVTLKGWYLPSQNGAAVMVLHGAGCNRMCVYDVGQMLHRGGYGVLLFDLRAHGDSGGEIYRSGWQDVLAAVEYLNARPEVTSIGAWGFSLGGMAVLQGAAKSPDIEAVIADGASIATLDEYPHMMSLTDWLYLPYDVAYFASLPMHMGETLTPVSEAVAQITPRPLMLIATDGAGGSRFELNCAEQLYARAGEPRTLWTVPNATHGGGFALYPDEYERRILTFFNLALLTGA